MKEEAEDEKKDVYRMGERQPERKSGARCDGGSGFGNRFEPPHDKRSSSMAHISSLPRSKLDNFKQVWRADQDD